jgi:hypothetical protein
MDSKSRERMIKTRALIETARREISQLREEIESTRNTVDRALEGVCRQNHGVDTCACRHPASQMASAFLCRLT